MAAHRYWRLAGFAVAGAGSLELSEVQLYAGGARVGGTVVPSCPFAPASGTLADLSDGLATGVVSWPASAHRAPGFALVWDLTGAGADVDALRLGAGNSAATFPLDCTVQYSDDGLVWATWRDYMGLAYPGGLGWTVDPTDAVFDPDFDKVVLLLPFDGVNGGTVFTDNAPTPKTVTTYGGAVISTAQSKWGGASAYFDGTHNSYAAIQNSIEFDLASQDFTIDVWVYFIASGAAGSAIFGRWGIGPSTNTDFLLAIAGGKLVFLAGRTGGVVINATGALPGGAWVHVAVTRSGNVWTLWQGGVAVATQTSAFAFAIPYSPLQSLRISCWDDPLSFFKGYIDDLRITKGVSRYATNFTPPTEPFPNMAALPLAAPYLPRLRSAEAMPSRISGSALPNGAASSHLSEYAFFDAYHGGLGIIYGTVKEKQTPANAPLRRKVWLLDERSGLVIRETWSDAATGAYEFRGIKQGVPYTVLAYDHAHNYRAFAGDNLLPDPLP